MTFLRTTISSKNSWINDIPTKFDDDDDDMDDGGECSIVQHNCSSRPEMGASYSSSLLKKLGNHYYERGNYDDALIVYKQGVEKIKLEAAMMLDDTTHNPATTTTSHNNNNNDAIIDLLTKMGEIYKIRGDYQEALSVHKEVFEIKRKQVGGAYPHPDLCSTLSHVAAIHYETKCYEKSLKTYQQVLQIQRYNAADRLEVSSTLVSIGLVFFKMEYHQYALHTFEESLRIQKQLLLDDGGKSKNSSITEQNRPTIAIILYNIGMVYLELGDDETALLYYNETLRLERLTLGENHKDIAITLEHIGYVYQQRGEIDKAIKYFDDAVEIYKINASATSSLKKQENDLLIAQAFNNIGNLHLQKGQIHEMVTKLSEAIRYLYRSGKNDDDLSIRGLCYYALSKIHPESAPAA